MLLINTSYWFIIDHFYIICAGVYILFENSYTFHNFSLNLPPSEKNFALWANFGSNFYKCSTFLREKTLSRSEVGG